MDSSEKHNKKKTTVHEHGDHYVVRTSVSSAIHVEKTVTKAPDVSANEGFLVNKIPRVLRCCCLTDPSRCPTHPGKNSDLESDRISETTGLSPKSNVEQKPSKIIEHPEECNTMAQQMHKTKDLAFPKKQSERQLPSAKKRSPNNTKNINLDDSRSSQKNLQNNYSVDGITTPNAACYKTKMATSCIAIKDNTQSLHSLKGTFSALTTFTGDDNGHVKEWLARKLENKKKEKLRKLKEEEQERLEKEELQKREESNYRSWLKQKKEAERLKRAKEEKAKEKKSLEELEKEKKQLESELTYQYWLNRKQREEAAKKKKEKKKLEETKKEKQERALTNETEFMKWLESSKKRPAPLKRPKGLDSLKNPTPVSFVNPHDWVPNI